MPAPTTLITFRVRVPAHTRTVDLLGSWDNFSRPYAMKRDTQLGPGEWTGCHTFSNIVCDGDPSVSITSRQGALRQGGRYWYYYRLDNDADDYNRSERSTTSCPLLPGQVVNIVHIPYAFSGCRSRTSSTSSENRTMNPEDRYMNPRPVPIRPIERVATSPTLPAYEHGSQLASLWLDERGKQRQHKLRSVTRKTSMDSLFPSMTRKSGGLRGAFRVRTPRSRSPGEPIYLSSNTARHHTLSKTQSRDRSTSRRRELLLRSEPVTPIQTLLFGEHRRRRSTSIDLAVDHTVAPASMPKPMPAPLTSVHVPALLDTLVEVLSPDLKSSIISSSEVALQDMDLHKRLPTLPNTPSSAYPPSLPMDSPERRAALDQALAKLESHLPAATISTEQSPVMPRHCEVSRFSAWTTSTGIDSVLVDRVPPALPPLDYDLFGTLTSSRLDAPFDIPALSVDSSRSSVSSGPSVSWPETDDDETGSTHDTTLITSALKTPQYNLPGSKDGPGTITLKATATFGTIRENDFVSRKQNRDSKAVHSETMQRLLDELGYLAELIQQ